jgi:hypothetical protein
MKKYKNILVLLSILTVAACVDGKSDEYDNIATDINNIYEGFVRYHEFNGNDKCPTTSVLMATDFINDEFGQFGTLIRPTSLYKISPHINSNCLLSVIYDGSNFCSKREELKLTTPVALDCSLENRIKMVLPTKS